MEVNIGFMQGRLSKIVDNKIQCFPKESWQQEFEFANQLGLKFMEWTIDYEKNYLNPLLSEKGQDSILSLCKKYNVSINSLTGDCFMHKPFWKEKNTKLKQTLLKNFEDIIISSHVIGINFIVFPLVDNGSLESVDQENELIDLLIKRIYLLKKYGMQIIFESDFDPLRYKKFIKKFPKEHFGVNYDTGNSASLGFNPKEEFYQYGNRIKNIHIKDRKLNGSSVPLKKGDVNFKEVFKLLKSYNYSGNLILQTARATDDNHCGLIKKYKSMVEDFILE